MGSKKTRAAVSAVTYILISILAVICVFPFFWMLISALKPKDEIRSAVPSLLIDNPTIDNFRRVLVDNGFLTYIKNSFVVSLAATLISMIIAVLAGYALSRYYRKRSVNTAFDLLHPSVCFPHDLIKFRYGEIRCRTSYELQFIQLVYMKPCCYLVLIVWKQHHSRNIFVPILCCNEAFYFVIHCKSSIISLSEHTCFSPAASVPISLRKSYPLGTTGV